MKGFGGIVVTFDLLIIVGIGTGREGNVNRNSLIIIPIGDPATDIGFDRWWGITCEWDQGTGVPGGEKWGTDLVIGNGPIEQFVTRDDLVHQLIVLIPIMAGLDIGCPAKFATDHSIKEESVGKEGKGDEM